MNRIKQYFKPYRWLYLAVMFFTLIQATASLALPYFMSDIVNVGIQQSGIDSLNYREIVQEYTQKGIDLESLQREYIIKVGAKMVGVSIVSAIAVIGVVYFAAKFASGVARDLRTAVFSKIERFHNREFDQFSSASLITRSTNDVMQIQMMLVTMTKLIFMAPIMAIGGISMALAKSVSLSWTIGLAVIVLFGAIVILFQLIVPRFKKFQKLLDKMTKVLRQTLSGTMVVRAFNTQKYEIDKFEDANEELAFNSLYINKLIVIMPAGMTLVLNLTTILIIWFGAKEIAASSMKVGDMMAYIQFAIMVIMSFLMMSMMFVMLPRASVSANRIADVLETELSISDQGAVDLNDFNGNIRFDDVTFCYEKGGEPALKNISFTIDAGTTTAIIGATGSGKTTLLNLIMRFYDVTDGAIYFDDKNIQTLTTKSIRNHIGYVPQKSILMSGTIKSNMLFAKKDATDEEIEAALKTAQIYDFVMESDDGIETHVSQGGMNFSGGQKQRLTISRALMNQSMLYLFDDSFSALDFSTDKALRTALKNQCANATFIIVAQRVSSIKQADQIIVLEEGEIVGVGKHSELLKHCAVYREIAKSQLSEEELHA